MQMTEKQKELLGNIKIGAEHEIVKNHFSGVEVSLPPEAVAVYDVILGCKIHLQQRYDDDIADIHDAALDVFIKNWPNHYMTLLD